MRLGDAAAARATRSPGAPTPAARRRGARGWGSGTSSPCYPHAGELLDLEQVGVERHPGVLELLGELGPDPHRLEGAPVLAVLVEAHGEVEHEEVLHDDH